jgi:hypothetical protein
MYKSAQAVLQAWVEGVNGADLDSLSALYHPEAILLPTFSYKKLTTEAAILDYFVQLSSRSGLAVELHDNTLRTQNYAGHVEVISGIYRWRFEVEDEPLSFEARFSFMVDLSNERPIVHHHSSQVPRGMVP